MLCHALFLPTPDTSPPKKRGKKISPCVAISYISVVKDLLGKFESADGIRQFQEGWNCFSLHPALLEGTYSNAIVHPQVLFPLLWPSKLLKCLELFSLSHVFTFFFFLVSFNYLRDVYLRVPLLSLSPNICLSAYISSFLFLSYSFHFNFFKISFFLCFYLSLSLHSFTKYLYYSLNLSPCLYNIIFNLNSQLYFYKMYVLYLSIYLSIYAFPLLSPPQQDNRHRPPALAFEACICRLLFNVIDILEPYQTCE